MVVCILGVSLRADYSAVFDDFALELIDRGSVTFGQAVTTRAANYGLLPLPRHGLTVITRISRCQGKHHPTIPSVHRQINDMFVGGVVLRIKGPRLTLSEVSCCKEYNYHEIPAPKPESLQSFRSRLAGIKRARNLRAIDGSIHPSQGEDGADDTAETLASNET